MGGGKKSTPPVPQAPVPVEQAHTVSPPVPSSSGVSPGVSGPLLPYVLLETDTEVEELLALPKTQQLLRLFEEESEGGDELGGGEPSSSSTSQLLGAAPASIALSTLPAPHHRG